MFFLTVKTIFISLLLIALIHYLYGFFKNTLTVPKVKDLVNNPAKRYNDMFAVINRDHEQEHIQNIQNIQTNGQQNMQAELKNFLNELKKPEIPSITNMPVANESAFGSYNPF